MQREDTFIDQTYSNKLAKFCWTIFGGWDIGD